MRLLLLTIVSTLTLFGCTSNTTDLSILFDNVSGLEIGNKVLCNGKEIGEVAEMTLYKNQVLVKIAVEKSVKMPFGSTFTSENKDLLGGRIISVQRSNSSRMLTDRDTINGVVADFSLNTQELDSLVLKSKLDAPLKKILVGTSDLVDSLKNGKKK